MSKELFLSVLQRHGVKATANRLLILDTLDRAERPLSAQEIEARLGTIDKSGISRTLQLFRSHHLLHVLESSDCTLYELCRSDIHSVDDSDTHVHFHCEHCGRTFCIDNTPIPPVELPAGYQPRSATYIVKGVCAECADHK